MATKAREDARRDPAASRPVGPPETTAGDRPRTRRGAVQLIVSSRADTRLVVASEWLRRAAPDEEMLLVGPSPEAVDDLARTSLGECGARFGLRRLTLPLLAVQLATSDLARQHRVPASGLALAAVTARAVHALSAVGALRHFDQVASRPGFPFAVSHTVQELRMNGIGASSLAPLAEGGADLAALLDRIQHDLAEVRLADRAIVFRAAREATEAVPPPPWVGLPLLLLDLKVGTTLEAELIAALAARAPRVLATAPAGDPLGLARLERCLECRAQRINAGNGPGSLAALQNHLFEETAPPEAPLDDSVVVTSWPGEARECVEIARRVQAEAVRGVTFDRMGILLRSPEEYRTFLEEALHRAEIPAYFERGTRRPDPAGRALLALLACAAEGLSARRFAEYLSLSQVPDPAEAADPDRTWTPPDHDLVASPGFEELEPAREVASGDDTPLTEDPRATPVIAGSLRAPWRWEQLLVEASVIGGADRWERRLAGLAAELALKRAALGDDEEDHVAALDRQNTDLAHLSEYALPVIARLAALPQKASWGEWLEHLRALAAVTLRTPAAVLATLEELEPMAPVGPIELEEVRLVLAPRLGDLAVAPSGRRYGAVFVAPAEAARGMTFDVVFVPGLAEKLFPRKIVEDPILPDEQRREIADTLVTQPDRVTTERLSLRIAAGAARTRLHLSYPRIDIEKARPRVPSFYALEALRAAEGTLPGFDRLGERTLVRSGGRLGWPAPERPEEAIDDAEFDLALLAPLLEADPETVTGTAHYLLSANPHLRRALRARARRWIKRWTSDDGLVDPEGPAAEALAAHRLESRSFSPTALQNFAICPYRFVLQALVRLEPREEPVAIETLDPLTRGALFHDVQFELLSHLRDRDLLPVSPATLERALAALDERLDREARRYADQLAPAIPRVWEDAINAVRADLREWLRRAAESHDGWVPSRFELAFGLAGRERPHADPASVPDPIPVAGHLQLRGSIDLVERSSHGTLRATDHKTGKARAKTGVRIGGGEVLQPVLYALALEQLVDETVEEGRLYYCTATGGFEERVVPLDEQARATAEEVAAVVGRALEHGFLPAAPARGACQWCDYRAVCGPFEEFRVSRKPQERLTDLKKLRRMP